MSEMEVGIRSVVLDEGPEKTFVLQREAPYPAKDYTLKEAHVELLAEEDWGEVKRPAREVLEVMGSNTFFPIIGVTGMMNSGKSSTVRSFLSEQGRVRVLTGEQVHEGTQRFVFWFPGRTEKDEEFRNLIEAAILRIFETAPEYLNADREAAWKQYNANQDEGSVEKLFETPLVAFDDGLNDLGFGLLDCPDVQRVHAGDDRAEDRRLKFVRRASQLCSVICFVARPEGLEDKTALTAAKTIDRQMPGVDKFILVNQVNPKKWSTTDQVVQLVKEALMGVGFQHVFLAYHNDIPDSRERIPKELQARFGTSDDPIYFGIDRSNRNATLGDFFGQLDHEKLEAALTGAHRQRLFDATKESRKRLWTAIKTSNETAEKLRRALLDLCREFSLDDGEHPRIPITDKMAQEIFASFKRTAPLAAKPMVWVANVSGGAKRISKQSEGKIRAARIEAKALAERTRNLFPVVDPISEWGSEDQHTNVWNSVLKKAADQPPSLNRNDLDRATAKFWKEASDEYGVWVVAAFVVAVGVAIFFVAVPVGGAAVAILGQASVFELVGAGLLGGGFAVGLQELMNRSVFQEIRKWVFPKSFSNLFSFACDSFGLPREISGNATTIHFKDEDDKDVKMEVPRCGIKAQPPQDWVPKSGYWSEISEGWNRLDTLLRSNLKDNGTD